LFVNRRSVGDLDTTAEYQASEVEAFVLRKRKVQPVKIASPPKKRKKRKPRELSIVANGKHVRFYGISFERASSGVLYDSIGPVGADSKVYLDLDRKSFSEHLAEHDAALVVIWLGGNDALKMRRKWFTAADVRRQYSELIDVIRAALPKADCMLWGPMDSGS